MKLWTVFKYGVWIALLVVLVWISQFFNVADYINNLKDYLSGFGALGPLVIISLVALAVVVAPLPSSPIAVSAGLVYGPWLGTLYTLIGAEIGAIIAFLIARGLGRAWLYKTFKREMTFCYHCTVKFLTGFIFLVRLIPFIHFDIVSYAAGLTAIPLRNYAIATFLGMIPITFIEVAVGASFTPNALWLAVSLLLMVAFILVPVLLERYNPFGLKKYLFHKPHKP